jgi:hypothetical protein
LYLILLLSFRTIKYCENCWIYIVCICQITESHFLMTNCSNFHSIFLTKGLYLPGICMRYIWLMSYIYLVHTFISMQTILMHTPVFQCCIFCGAHLYFNAAYFVVHLYFNAAYFVVHTCISMLLILWHTLVFQCCIFCGAHLYFSDCSL